MDYIKILSITLGQRFTAVRFDQVKVDMRIIGINITEETGKLILANRCIFKHLNPEPAALMQHFKSIVSFVYRIPLFTLPTLTYI